MRTLTLVAAACGIAVAACSGSPSGPTNGDGGVGAPRCPGASPADGFPTISAACGQHVVWTEVNPDGSKSSDEGTCFGTDTRVDTQPSFGDGATGVCGSDSTGLFEMQVHLDSTAVGAHEPTGPNGHNRIIYSIGSSFLTSDMGGSGRTHIEVVGNDGAKFWGRFAANVCTADPLKYPCVDVEGTFAGWFKS